MNKLVREHQQCPEKNGRQKGSEKELQGFQRLQWARHETKRISTSCRKACLEENIDVHLKGKTGSGKS